MELHLERYLKMGWAHKLSKIILMELFAGAKSKKDQSSIKWPQPPSTPTPHLGHAHEYAPTQPLL